MAAADMGLPPSFPPTSTPQDCSKDNTLFVEVLVILAVLGIFVLHILGSLRRLSSASLLHSTVMGVYTLSYPLVSYTIGRMQSSDRYYEDFAVWAVFLLLLLGSTDNLTAYRLDDINNWKSIYVKHLYKGCLLVYTVLSIARDTRCLIPLYGILFVEVLRWYARIASMRMVSKSYICKDVKVIVEYMQHKDNLMVRFDPVTMEGCRYMVAGEKCGKRRSGCTPWCKRDGLKVTTVEHIWQCKGDLLNGDRGKVLKDLCLSMALSKMLNRRIAGSKFSEEELEKARDFAFKGLLAGDKPYKRAFRVIEEELVFIHDVYYTRYSYLYRKGRYLPLCLPVVMLGLWLWLTFLLRHEQDNFLVVTIFVTVTLALLEAYQLYLYMASGWFKVGLILSYVDTPFLRRSCCSEKMIDLLLQLKSFSPWKRTLGQYCLLQELGRQSRLKNCLHYATLRLVDRAKKGRKKSEKLSENVMKAIVESLLGSNGHLTNGVASLRKNGVHGKLLRACDATGTNGASTRTILVWHIATTLCEHQLDKQGKEDEAFKTTSCLSKYCMHLLAFTPNLMPDHSSISESILDKAINEAHELLEAHKDKKMEGKVKKIEGKVKKIEDRCDKLMEMIDTDDCVCGDQERLVAQGILLARNLIDNIQEPTSRWKVLSDFWAEMTLYVSPCDDTRAHLELLAKGGEFITQLWVLLTHAGVLNRSPTGPQDVV